MTADTRARIRAELDAARAWIDDNDPSYERKLERAIDALPSPDECADLLRLAAIGRQVEALDDITDITYDPSAGTAIRWCVEIGGAMGYGPTLDAAIAAATQEGS